MKTSTICLLAASAAAAAAPVAHAGPRVDYQQVFTTPVPGQSAGVDTRLFYKNPNDPKAKPIPVRREEFTFPAGTTYNESVVPDCTASDAEIRLFGKSACPAASWIGGGGGGTNKVRLRPRGGPPGQDG